MLETKLFYVMWCMRLFVAVGLLACTISVVKLPYKFFNFDSASSIPLQYRY